MRYLIAFFVFDTRKMGGNIFCTGKHLNTGTGIVLWTDTSWHALRKKRRPVSGTQDLYIEGAI